MDVEAQWNQFKVYVEKKLHQIKYHEMGHLNNQIVGRNWSTKGQEEFQKSSSKRLMTLLTDLMQMEMDLLIEKNSKLVRVSNSKSHILSPLFFGRREDSF